MNIQKNDIRSKIKLMNKNISKEFRDIASNIIFKEVEELNIFKSSVNILIYYSLYDEVNTHMFIEKWKSVKKIFLPRVNGDYLELIHYKNLKNLKRGKYNIFEPLGEATSLDEIDLIIVPAVAISPSGKRIGHGKGYYDRLLKDSDKTKIGVIFNHQLCEDFDDEPHDVRMDYVITENKVIKI